MAVNDVKKIEKYDRSPSCGDEHFCWGQTTDRFAAMVRRTCAPQIRLQRHSFCLRKLWKPHKGRSNHEPITSANDQSESVKEARWRKKNASWLAPRSITHIYPSLRGKITVSKVRGNRLNVDSKPMTVPAIFVPFQTTPNQIRGRSSSGVFHTYFLRFWKSCLKTLRCRAHYTLLSKNSSFSHSNNNPMIKVDEKPSGDQCLFPRLTLLSNCVACMWKTHTSIYLQCALLLKKRYI